MQKAILKKAMPFAIGTLTIDGDRGTDAEFRELMPEGTIVPFATAYPVYHNPDVVLTSTEFTICSYDSANGQRRDFGPFVRPNPTQTEAPFWVAVVCTEHGDTLVFSRASGVRHCVQDFVTLCCQRDE